MWNQKMEQLDAFIVNKQGYDFINTSANDVYSILILWSKEESFVDWTIDISKSLQNIWVNKNNIRVISFDETWSENFLNEIQKALKEIENIAWPEDEIFITYSSHWNSNKDMWSYVQEKGGDWAYINQKDISNSLKNIKHKFTFVAGSCNSGGIWEQIANSHPNSITITSSWESASDKWTFWTNVIEAISQVMLNWDLTIKKAFNKIHDTTSARVGLDKPHLYIGKNRSDSEQFLGK